MSISPVQGKYVQDRTSTQPKLKVKGVKSSLFMITCNPNKVMRPYEDPAAFQDMKVRIGKMADFMLEDKALKYCMKFQDPKNAQGETVPQPREWHLAQLKEFSHKSAAIEYGHKNKRLHCHMTFQIDHMTHVQLDRNKLQAIAGKFYTGLVKPESVHINIRAMTSNGFTNYLEKQMRFASLGESSLYVDQDEVHQIELVD